MILELDYPKAWSANNIIRVTRPAPKLGAKAVSLKTKATFVLSEGPGTLVAIIVTRAGSGMIIASDGVPDRDSGHYRPHAASFDEMGHIEEELNKDGLELFHLEPVVMGVYQLNAGFNHGLTIETDAGHSSVSSIFTPVWMDYVKRQ